MKQIVVRMGTLLLLWAGLVSCARLLTPSSELGIVRGVVLDYSSLQPIAAAVVRVDNSKIGAVTDSNGFFALTRFPLGRRQLRMDASNYTGAVLPRLNITRGSTTCTLVFLSAGQGRRATVTVATTPERPLLMIDGVVRHGAMLPDSILAVRRDPRGYWPHIFRTIPRDNITSIEIVQPAAAQQLYGAQGVRGIVAVTTQAQTRC